MAFYNNVIAGASGQTAAGGGDAAALQIEKSIRGNAADSSGFSRTPLEGNRQTWTWSAWVKRSKVATDHVLFDTQNGVSSTPRSSVTINASDRFRLAANTTGSSWNVAVSSENLLRDCSAWYHLCVIVDTREATASNRIRLFINGVEAAYNETTYPSQNAHLPFNQALGHSLATDTSSTLGLDGYITEVHFLDGIAASISTDSDGSVTGTSGTKYLSDFGEFDATTGIWKPKAYTGAYNGPGVTGRGGGKVFGVSTTYPLYKAFDGDSNTYASSNSGQIDSQYAILILDFGAGAQPTWSSSLKMTVWCSSTDTVDTSFNGGGWTSVSGSGWTEVTLATGSGTLTQLKVRRKKGNTNAGAAEIQKVTIDGTDLTNIAIGGSNGYRLAFDNNDFIEALGYSSAETPTVPPEGGFGTALYTGNGSAQTIDGFAFQPDLIWTKTRSNAVDHKLVDTVRGLTEVQETNQQRVDSSVTNGVTGLTAAGFSVGNSGDFNSNGRTYCAWAWKAGGAASSNSDGTITSTVSANPTHGFSVCTYTGTGSNGTFGHGLNSVPKFIIVKCRSHAQNWAVQHASQGPTKYQYLQTTNAFSTSGAGPFWNNTAPTSSVVHVGTDNDTNASSKTYVAYCWSEVPGFSKIGTYNGDSQDPPVIELGFEPGWVMVKRANDSDHWVIVDSDRGHDKALLASGAAVEDTANYHLRFHGTTFNPATGGATNATGSTYVYVAFAKKPGNHWNPSNLIATAGSVSGPSGMDVLTYSGNGSTQSISGLSFQPDLVWFKSRSSANHALFDSVRGVAKRLHANLTQAEDQSNSGLTAFNSGGFTMGSNGVNNASGTNYVAWCWKAGGAASSNSDGTITSSVSANDINGFSIVTYTGTGSNATVGHGLSSAPKWIIIKDRSQATGWSVYHDAIGTSTNNYIELQSDGAAGQDNTAFQNTAPTDSVFSIGTKAAVNESGDNFVAYCWSEIPAYSKFGSYSGDSSNVDVHTGFRPTYVLIKCNSHAGQEWIIKTSDRGGGTYLMAHSSSAEQNGRDITFTATGFTVASNNGPTNYSGREYIYMAFADKLDTTNVDSVLDTPTTYEAAVSGGRPGGNYCTLNPLTVSNGTVSQGGLRYVGPGSWKAIYGTMRVSTGKWYYEVTYPQSPAGQNSTNDYGSFGFSTGTAHNDSTGPSSITDAVFISATGWYKNFDGSKTNTSTTVAAGDVLSIAVDLDANTFEFRHNGSVRASGTIGGTAGRALVPFIQSYNSQYDGVQDVNFGQKPWAFGPPAGYKALCTQNLDQAAYAAVNLGSTAVDATLYSGNGGSKTITGINHSPDFVWIKQRSGAGHHALFDTVRGPTKIIYSNLNNAENTITNSLTAFTSDGFSVGSDNDVNKNANTYVAWTWDGGDLATATSSGYNQDRVWSDNVTGGREDEPARQMFDGGTSTFAQNPSGNTNPNNLIVTFSPGLAYTSSVEVYPYNASSVAINNGSQNSTTNQQWNTVVSGSGTLTKLDFQRNHTNGAAVSAIRVDGKILVDKGYIPIGGMNASAYNQTQTWSNQISGTVDTNYKSAAELFNGTIGAGYSNGTRSTNPGTLTLNVSSLNVPASTVTLHVYIHTSAGSPTLTVNGVSVPGSGQGTGNGDKVFTVPVSGGQLNTIAWSYDSGNGPYVYMRGIEIDGAVLVDSGVSMPNLPSIATQVRSNPVAGFSIVAWDNFSGVYKIAHGLSNPPAMIFTKSLSTNNDVWQTYHVGIGNNYKLYLSGSDAQVGTSVFNSEDPTDLTFNMNDNVTGYWVAYCFSPVEGFSSFGTYTGNGSTDGPFVLTGHRPAVILLKKKSSSSDAAWMLIDSSREPYNDGNRATLSPNASDSEQTTAHPTDLLSNGFKLRNSGGAFNQSGEVYVYASWAEHPFRNTLAR